MQQVARFSSQMSSHHCRGGGRRVEGSCGYMAAFSRCHNIVVSLEWRCRPKF